MYSYEDQGLAGDVKALRAVEAISINHCVMLCSVRESNFYIEDIGSQLARDEEDEPFHLVLDEEYAIVCLEQLRSTFGLIEHLSEKYKCRISSMI